MKKQIFDYKTARVLIKKNNKNYQDLADFFAKNGVNISISVIKNWFRKDDTKRANPEIQKIPIIAEFLGVEPSRLLLGFYNDNKQSVSRVPIVGVASCGLPSVCGFDIIDNYTYIKADDFKPQLYTLIANGESMSPEIDNGDEVVCDPTIKPLSGDLVHYTIHNESAIKVFYDNADINAYEFIPYNPSPEFKIRVVFKNSDEIQELKFNKVVKVVKTDTNNRLLRLKLIKR